MSQASRHQSVLPVIQDLSWGYNQTLGQCCDYLRAPIGVSISKVNHLAIGYFQIVTGKWPETSVPWHMSLSIGLFIACYPAACPRMRAIKRQKGWERIQGRKSQSFSNSSQKRHHFCHISFVRSESFVLAHTLKDGILKGYEYQDMGIILRPFRDLLIQ